MGLFDLDEYIQKKARADESATSPRSFPIAFADAVLGGRKQKLRFEPVLLDGGKVFISFRPEDADDKRTLIVGRRGDYRGGYPQGLDVDTDEAFEIQNWLYKAVENIEKGLYGRLTIGRGRDDQFVYSFFSSTGVITERDYIVYMDGHHGMEWLQRERDYDPDPNYDYWAKHNEAGELLVRLDADEFAAFLEQQKGEPNSVYGLSLRWAQVPFEEKCALLPAIEREIEKEFITLIRTVVWSDPSLMCGDIIGDKSSQNTPFWRRVRFFVEPSKYQGDARHVSKRTERRIIAFWPHVAAHFIPTFQDVDQNSVHPCVFHWMCYRGGYFIEFTEPSAHEHLEARLLLRDFLAEKGVSIEEIEKKLKRIEKRNAK